MSNNFATTYFGNEELRLTVLVNICKMLITRGYMDANKYMTRGIIDDKLFMSFIGKYADNSVYYIPLDTPYKDEIQEPHEFKNNIVVVKLISQNVKDVTNSPILNDFFKTYGQYHKIIVFDDMSDRVYTVISRKKNAEVFSRNALLIDLMSHVCSPNSCKLVSPEEVKHIINPKFSKIYENDPLCRYFNGKKGMILRIVRISINNVQEIGYRRIVEAQPLFYN